MEFTQLFKTVFDNPDAGQFSEQHLVKLKQSSLTTADYSIQFKILVAESG